MRCPGVCGMLLLAALVCGCGGESDAPSLVAATGTVLYNDKPISGADVTFMVEGSPIASGTTNAEGKFTISTGGRPGAPIGKAKVGITKAAATAAGGGDMKPEDLMKMSTENMGKTVEPPKPELPVNYGTPESSGLTAELDKDGTKNVFEFRLVD